MPPFFIQVLNPLKIFFASLMTPILRKFYKRSLPKFAFQLLQFRISSVTLHCYLLTGHLVGRK